VTMNTPHGKKVIIKRHGRGGMAHVVEVANPYRETLLLGKSRQAQADRQARQQVHGN